MKCVCGVRLTGRQRIFCSDECKRKLRYARNIQTECVYCGVSYLISKVGVETQRRRNQPPCCRKCQAKRTPPPSPSGENSPTWRGGHRYWSVGRFGKDKEGLSWKQQRRLAWERDDRTCQHCHKKKNRNPDVHHIKPWRESQSHALDNLICLCQSCHLKEEANVPLV